jgi:hypothetical protein
MPDELRRGDGFSKKAGSQIFRTWSIRHPSAVPLISRVRTTPEEAFEDQRWMFCGMTQEEEERIKLNLDQNLQFQDGLYKLPYERICYWAVMWWVKK